MIELSSTGKSGSFFYYTMDGRFTLKTIHKNEYQFLREILPLYHAHIKNNPKTLIIKFFGLHKIRSKIASNKREKVIHFVIMSNIFNTKMEIHERYDLKGSTYQRMVNEM